MENILDVARLFSSGRFDRVANRLADEVEFHIYEDNKHLIGKAQVLSFCQGIADYFASIDTEFKESGHLVSTDKVAIYGYGEFRRKGDLVNAVNSCDVYEFNPDGLILKIHSYCKSNQQ